MTQTNNFQGINEEGYGFNQGVSDLDTKAKLDQLELSLRQKENDRRKGLREREHKSTFTGKGVYAEEVGTDTDEDEAMSNRKKTKKRSSKTDKKANRNPWQAHEDENLKMLVEKYGKKWSVLSKLMGSSRTGKQIRDRWVNKLDRSIHEKSWTTSEDELLLRLWHCFGNKWSEIAKYINGRTESMVKNRYYSHIVKKRLGKNGQGSDNNMMAIEKIQESMSAEHCESNDMAELSNSSNVTAKLEEEDCPAKQEVKSEHIDSYQSSVNTFCKLEANGHVKQEQQNQTQADFSELKCTCFDHSTNYQPGMNGDMFGIAQMASNKHVQLMNLMQLRYLEVINKSPMIQSRFGLPNWGSPKVNLEQNVFNSLQNLAPNAERGFQQGGIYSGNQKNDLAYNGFYEYQSLLLDARNDSRDTQVSQGPVYNEMNQTSRRRLF